MSTSKRTILHHKEQHIGNIPYMYMLMYILLTQQTNFQVTVPDIDEFFPLLLFANA